MSLYVILHAVVKSAKIIMPLYVIVCAIISQHIVPLSNSRYSAMNVYKKLMVLCTRLHNSLSVLTLTMNLAQTAANPIGDA